MDNSFDYSTGITSNIFVSGGNPISDLSEHFIGAIFHNMDTTNTIYIGKSDVLSGGENGFGIEKGEMVDWRAEGDISEVYAVAGGGVALKLSYVLWK